MIEMALRGPSSQLPDFTLWLQVQSPELGYLLGRVKMSIKANRRTWDPQGTGLSLYSQGAHPSPQCHLHQQEMLCLTEK